jgi:excinuclease ABC subunit A
VIAEADWIIDLGPEGGVGGGTIVAAAPPEGLVQVSASHTGQALKPVLARAAADGGEAERQDEARVG